MEGGLTGDSLPCHSLQTGALVDPPNVELESPTVLPSPVSANDDPARERTGSVI